VGRHGYLEVVVELVWQLSNTRQHVSGRTLLKARRKYFSEGGAGIFLAATTTALPCQAERRRRQSSF